MVLREAVRRIPARLRASSIILRALRTAGVAVCALPAIDGLALVGMVMLASA